MRFPWCKYLTVPDRWLIGVLLVLSLGGIFLTLRVQSEAGQVAVIRQNGEVLEKITLQPGFHEILHIPAAHPTHLVEVDGSRVRMLEAPCPDKDCIHMGWISNSAQSIVCLPYKIVISIEGGKKPDVDSITR